jgi:hypothetical protein
MPPGDRTALACAGEDDRAATEADVVDEAIEATESGIVDEDVEADIRSDPIWMSPRRHALRR